MDIENMKQTHDRIRNLLIDRDEERKKDLQRKKLIKSLQSSDQENVQYFRDDFDERKKQIDLALLEIINSENQLLPNDLANRFDNITKQINLLQKFVSDSTIFLKEYEIRRSQETLHDLIVQTNELEKKYLPKKKFGFKSKKQVKPVVIDVTTPKLDEIDGNYTKTKYAYDTENEYNGFKSKTGETLKLEADSIDKKDVTLSSLINCTVILTGAPSTLHMNNLKHCIVLSGPIGTSIFIENCENCKFLLACQQLRLHSSIRCDFYLHVTSRAIIEDSNAIQFAPYHFFYDQCENDFQRAGLDLKINHWNTIDDFNWLATDKKSPNWDILDEKNRIIDWTPYLNS